MREKPDKVLQFNYTHNSLGKNTAPHAGPNGEALGLIMRKRRELWASIFILFSMGRKGSVRESRLRIG